MAASERGRKLYIGGLLDTVHKEDLAKEFKKYGEVSDVWVARNPPGFAFVEFTTAVNAEKAVRALDGMNVCGSRIRVEFANSSNGKGGERRAMMKSNNRAYSGSQNNRGASRSRSPPNRDRRNSDSPAQYGNSHRRGRSPFSSSSRLLGLDPISAAAAALFGAAGHPGQATGIPYGLAGLLPVMPPNELLRSIRRRKPSPNRHSSPSNRRRPRYGRGYNRQVYQPASSCVK